MTFKIPSSYFKNSNFNELIKKQQNERKTKPKKNSKSQGLLNKLNSQGLLKKLTNLFKNQNQTNLLSASFTLVGNKVKNFKFTKK